MNHAHQYASTNDMQRRDAASTLREFFPRLRWDCGEDSGEDGDEAVLDVGSGTGDVTAEVLLPLLPARVRRVVGADVSPVMVRHAAGAHAHLRPRLRFVQADIAAADLRASPLRAEAGERGFSKIFSFYCLNWVQDQRTCFSNIYQLLRTGGEAVLLIITKAPLYDSYLKLQSKPIWMPYMQDVYDFLSPYYFESNPVDAFLTLSQRIGFDVLDCNINEQVHVYDTDYFADIFKSVNPFIDRIPDEMKETFMKDIVKETHVEYISSDEASQEKEKLRYTLLVMFAHLVKDSASKNVKKIQK